MPKCFGFAVSASAWSSELTKPAIPFFPFVDAGWMIPFTLKHDAMGRLMADVKPVA
jgi:hypothetical protein